MEVRKHPAKMSEAGCGQCVPTMRPGLESPVLALDGVELSVACSTKKQN